PGESFKVPQWENGYQPLGGEAHPLLDGMFDENPAKWTGNGSRSAQPNMYDWYETVKINYGVRPDGSHDFESLPDEYSSMDYKAHFEFWKDKDVPDSWIKFRDIALYWIEKGVDGFRYDMSEMVPVEFWSYMNSAIKMKKEDTFLLAEIYNPSVYRDYIHKGKMDYLYDKVQLYDTIKHVMQGHGKTDNIPPIQEELKDIEHHMLHFLENHDEQRIASPDFAGSAEKGKPAMVVSTTISSSPTLIYFAQELGEPGAEDAGFGKPTRTSIFDYIGVPHLQRWVNDKKFDGGRSSDEELELRDFYGRLLNYTIESSAMAGSYQDLHAYNRQQTEGYYDKVLSYARWHDDEKLIILANFDPEVTQEFDLRLPADLIKTWNLNSEAYELTDQLYNTFKTQLRVEGDLAKVAIKLNPLESFILKIKN
ncbi:MAG: alpha-amylase, partial [Flavobacteriaceae bacterium]|nr:alpha-amylase [Flavobacteriaceae bacterium]